MPLIPPRPRLPARSGAGPDGETSRPPNPRLVSPVNNVELSTVRPSLQIGGSSAKFANQDFDYEFEIQTSGGATVHKQVVGGMSSTPGDDLQTQSTYKWRARAVLGSSVGPWSDFATFRTISIPGCINGLLLDPAAYFFYVIKRQPGQSANDWISVMNNSGIPPGPPPGVDPGPQFYGLTQQTGSSGPRSRVFLPALDSDAFGYRVSAYDYLANGPGGLVWTFRFFDGGGYDRAPAPSPTQTTLSTVILSFRGRAAHRRCCATRVSPDFRTGWLVRSRLSSAGGARRSSLCARPDLASFTVVSAQFTPVGRWQADANDPADYRFIAEDLWGVPFRPTTYDVIWHGGWGDYLRLIPFRSIGLGSFYLLAGWLRLGHAPSTPDEVIAAGIALAYAQKVLLAIALIVLFAVVRRRWNTRARPVRRGGDGVSADLLANLG